MRKRCASCGFISFRTDESCKKCGSSDLEVVSAARDFAVKPARPKFKPMRWRHYILNFGLAVFIEFLALFPFLMFAGGDARGEPDFLAKMLLRVDYVLHLPSSVFVHVLYRSGCEEAILFTPLLQIVFWTFLLNFLARRRRQRFR